MKNQGSIISSIVGPLGSGFAALCCIGFPVLVGALGTVGAGFLINDKYLLPLMSLSLLLSFYGLITAYKKRHKRFPLMLGVSGGVLLFAAVILGWKEAVYIGLLALFVSSIINIKDGLRQHFVAT